MVCGEFAANVQLPIHPVYICVTVTLIGDAAETEIWNSANTAYQARCTAFLLVDTQRLQ
jgi:hypothetical protein